MISLDKKTEGRWLETLSDNLKKFSRTKLEIIGKYGMAGFCRGVEDTDAELTKKIFTVLDQEIEERKKNKEPGWGE